eukprot:390357-Pyramimonas_sp.AAC.1
MYAIGWVQVMGLMLESISTNVYNRLGSGDGANVREQLRVWTWAVDDQDLPQGTATRGDSPVLPLQQPPRLSPPEHRLPAAHPGKPAARAGVQCSQVL